MQSLKSKIILALLKHSHLLRFHLKRVLFDSSIEGIQKLRERTDKASRIFGKLPKEAEIEPISIGNRYAEWMKLPGNVANKTILYFHGGMYLIGSPKSHRQHVIKLVKGAGINALVFDYRLAPEHPFPAALNDALAAYHYLLKEGFTSSNIVFAGDSAGGGLCLATLLALKEEKIPLPAGAVLISPWTDLMLTGESNQINKMKCLSPIGCAEKASALYANGKDKRNPLISPLYGNLKGLPPLYIVAGEHEILLDDSIRFAEKARAADVEVTLRIEEGMCHCYPAFGNLFRESKLALNEICHYIERFLLS